MADRALGGQASDPAGQLLPNILRKLGVPGRVQAAALAERAGLLGS